MFVVSLAYQEPELGLFIYSTYQLSQGWGAPANQRAKLRFHSRHSFSFIFSVVYYEGLMYFEKFVNFHRSSYSLYCFKGIRFF